MDHRIAHRAELRTLGYDRFAIADAVASGQLIRARRDHYLLGSTPRPIVEAVRVGGKISCVSLLSLVGVFVLARPGLHVSMRHTDSRMRSPHDRRVGLLPRAVRAPVLHWMPPIRPTPRDDPCTSVLDALVHSVLCQEPRAAIATLDSALHLGLIGELDLDDMFAALPRRYRPLRRLVDASAQSGPETLMRLILRSIGCRIQPQAWFPGVGYVDFLVDGWLVVECDSEEFHGGWAAQARDRERDLALAALGLVPLRVTAADIMWRADRVRAAIVTLRTRYGS